MRHQPVVNGFLACVCLLTVSAVSAHADGVLPRVRPVDGRVADALLRGCRDSPTLAGLVDALERSDVIVHIDTRWFRYHGIVAETRFITRAAGQRYVRVSIDAHVGGEAAIALLGHELQHAWEIAQELWVIDEAGFAELYRRIGHAAGGGDGRVLRVDTRAGPGVERQVFVELRGARRRRGAEHLPGAD